jgi:hypothetical protein
MEHKNKKETRGRKKLDAGKAKTKVVRARVTPAEHQKIEQAAGELGISEWARDKLLTAATKALRAAGG